jgi:hypothetical protein
MFGSGISATNSFDRALYHPDESESCEPSKKWRDIPGFAYVFEALA